MLKFCFSGQFIKVSLITIVSVRNVSNDLIPAL